VGRKERAAQLATKLRLATLFKNHRKQPTAKTTNTLAGGSSDVLGVIFGIQ
jgi:hypothetical protein